jgi:hypothetical protein
MRLSVMALGRFTAYTQPFLIMLHEGSERNVTNAGHLLRMASIVMLANTGENMVYDGFRDTHG